MMGDKRKYLIISSTVCLFLLYELIFYHRKEQSPRLVVVRPKTVGKFHETSGNGSSRALSIIGQWLRAPEATPPPKRRIRNDSSPVLLILVWKYGPFLERRHVRRSNRSSSPWQGCSVNDCRLSYRDNDLSKADAVIFHLHLTRSPRELPSRRGKPGQIWIFMTDESPLHTFLHSRARISDYDDLFDWSMTYRTDSDVPVPYGRTITARTTRDLHRPTIHVPKQKLVAVMISNCSTKNSRWNYVRRLKNLLAESFDIYGRCHGANSTACPGHFHDDCPILGAYKFYLAFENSNCREYFTEKIFWNAYEKKSVPVVMGPSRDDCERFLPPRSFIHVDDFHDPAELAYYLVYLDANDTAYDVYHQWRSRYVVVNEHGYFGSRSKHYCRVCEALRYNVPPTGKYRRMEDFWNSGRDCRRDFRAPIVRAGKRAEVQIGGKDKRRTDE